ncbi:MAG TPA: type II secretion system secretin GspD [Burkholderiaceae bacterium]|nr:type II secretion system secretin GspD [Burkholderiaceae bacterium]
MQRLLVVLAVAAWFVPALTWAPDAAAAEDQVTLNFKDADVDSIVGAFGHLLNRTFIIDPRVRGKMTLETPRPVSRQQAYQMLQASLRMQGFAIVEANGVAKVVPEADAKLQSGPVNAGRAPSRGGDQMVTQIFRLQYESATNLVPVLRPLISPNNTVTAYPNNNSLVITDYAANLERIARIIAGLDSPSTNELEVIPIRHALASDVAVTVSRMVDDSTRAGQAAQVDAGQRVVVLADPRSNSVMVRASSAAKVNLAKTLIMRLDQPASSPGNINVVYLRNAEAVKLAQTLRAVLTGGAAGDPSGSGSMFGGTATGMTPQMTGQQQQQQGMSPLGASGTSPANTPLQGSGQQSNQPVSISAGGAIIAADPATNSLIITAPEPLYRNLRAVIDRLDARRAQVHIESLIVEISSERAAEIGVQWQALNPGSGGTRVIGGTNLSARGSGSNILDVATNLTSVGQGLNIGVVRGTVNIAGTEILNLGLLARALESNNSANVLATPNLLTLDNEEARIIIGQNVPFVTGQFTLPGAGGGTVNPFQTVERKDVGTTLRVKPQVSEAGTVKLQIFQEVSSVQDRSLSAGLITNRRAIESNVLVDDGQIVVLGGLLEDRIEGSNEKVPGLGDIPVLGNLFRYDSRRRVKTNLMVFLRPVVVRDVDAAQGVTADRYDYIRQLRADSRLPSHWALPDLAPNPLPAMPPAPPPGMRVVPSQPQGSPQQGAPQQPGMPQAPAQPGAPQSMAPQGAPSQAVPPQAAPGQPPATPPPATAPTAEKRAPPPAVTALPSMSPDISGSQAVPRQEPAPISRSRPSMLQVAPNEPLTPLNRVVPTDGGTQVAPPARRPQPNVD